MNRTARTLVGIASTALLLSLGLLPSAAQEAAPPKAEPPATASPPPATAQAPKADAEASEAEEAEEEPRSPEERVSADNNLSFPVDI